MYCRNCGNELNDNEKYCGKCGTKVDDNVSDVNTNVSKNKANIKEPIKIKFTHFIIGIIIIFLIPTCIVFIKNSKGVLTSASEINTENYSNSKKSKSKNILSNNELTKILKVSENGIYLKDTTVKVGASSNINYNNYDYLITYSSIFENNGITLKAGGALLYNTKDKTNQILTFPSDLTGIIYYLNTEGIDENLKSIADIIAEYIEKYGTQQLFNNTSEQYVEMGKAIGQNVGVKLCRNVAKSYMTEMNADMSNCVFLYNKDEIFLKYIGINTTVQVYNWQGIIDETGARLMATNNYSAYRNMIAIYGEPYTNKTKFVVYEFINDTTKEVNKYDSLQKAKEALNVEE